MKNKRICSLISFCIAFFVSFLFWDLGESVICRASTALKEVEAIYYINNTGNSSKYISKDDCEEVGTGTISFDHDLDKLVIRNEPETVEKYLTEVPDFSDFVEDGQTVRWMTIYRSATIHRVIGEIVEAEETDIPEESEPLVLGQAPEEKSESTEETGDLLIIGDPEEPTERSTPSEEETIEIDEEEPVPEAPSGGPTETKDPNTFASKDEMRKASLEDGDTVSTSGYYEAGDGGAAEYTISKKSGTVYEKLANGLYANLVYSDTLDVKQLGAVGDGVTDDSAVFKKIAKLGVPNVTIAAGTYNLNNSNIIFSGPLSITGVDASSSIIKNFTITAPYGLDVTNITADGGAPKDTWVPGTKYSTSVLFYVTPKAENTSIHYTDCVFKNAGFLSMAMSQDATFKEDIVTGCTFSNAERACIYHSCNSKYTNYNNNVFTEIGNTDTTDGPVTGLWIGDVTNIYSTRTDYLEITDNKFINLYTGDDFDPTSRHAINANFIAVRADVAVIKGNYVKNLYGYGNDREAVYTKVRELTLDDNKIYDGGSGEGYICNKGADGDFKATVTNNLCEGEYGTGMCLYGTTVVKDNTIQISHCKSAIVTGVRKNQTGNWPHQIVHNTINCGSGEPYVHGGMTFTDYSGGNLIKVISPINDVTISDNTINPTSVYTSFIAIGNAQKSITVEKNKINASGLKGTGISIYTTSDASADTSQKVVIDDNKIEIVGGQRAVSIAFKETGSKRTIKFTNNNITFDSGSKKNNALILTSGSKKDKVELSGNVSNLAKKVVYVTTPSTNVVNNNADFANVETK